MDIDTREGQSLGSLFGDLTRETSALFRKEVELAKAEMSEKVSEVKSSMTSLAIGGAVLFAGILTLLGALVAIVYFWLAPWPHAIWVAPLAVGAIITLIGFVLLQIGRSHLSAASLAPRRFVQSLRRDTQLARE